MTTPKTVYICIYWTQCVKYIRIDKNAENITGSHAVYISITKCPICSWTLVSIAHVCHQPTHGVACCSGLLSCD